MFVQNLIKGMSQRQAYIQAGYKHKSDKRTDEDACKLLKTPKVSQRYNFLIDEAKNKSLWSREKAEKELLEMLKTSKEAFSFAGMSNAIKELNQLNRLNNCNQEKEKIEIEIMKVELEKKKLELEKLKSGDNPEENETNKVINELAEMLKAKL